MAMKNIPGWFPQTNKDTLTKLIEEHNVKTVIEIGSFVGLSAVWFAERVEHVLTIDPFDAITRINYLRGEMLEAAKDQWGNFLENIKGHENIHVIKGTSEEAHASTYSHFPHGKCAGGVHDKICADLIYIDGSHEYEDVKKDIELWHPRAIKILCGDDYTESWPGVRKAVDECGRLINKKQRVWYHLKNTTTSH